MKTLSRIGIVLALGTSLAASAFAAPESYNLDSNHSFSRFAYNHFGLSTQQSRFDKTTGTVMLNKVAKTGAVDVVIDTKSVSTGSGIFNGHIQGEDYLDTAKFPTATFKSTKVVFEGDKPSTIEGNLTLKGVTKPVVLKVTGYMNMAHPFLKKDAIGADATVTIKRSDFNMGKSVPLVGDDVTITVAIEAIKVD